MKKGGTRSVRGSLTDAEKRGLINAQSKAMPRIYRGQGVIVLALLISNLSVLMLGVSFSNMMGASMGNLAEQGYRTQLAKAALYYDDGSNGGERTMTMVRKGGGGESITPNAPLITYLQVYPLRVDIVWVDNALNETYFTIERATSTSAATTWAQMSVLAANCNEVPDPSYCSALNYSDVNAIISTATLPAYTYKYRVKACIGTSCSTSNTIEIIPWGDIVPPGTPSALRATVRGCYTSQATGAKYTLVDLSWDPTIDYPSPVPSVTGVGLYRIYRDGQHQYYVAGQTPYGTDSIYSVAATTTYQYSVSAVDKSDNEGSRSVVLPVTVGPCI